jgi:hypothetical protein
MRAIVLVPALLGFGAPGVVTAQERANFPITPQIANVPACRIAPANRRCALGTAFLTPRTPGDDEDRYLTQADRLRQPSPEKTAEIRLGFAKVTASVPF